MNTKVNIKKTLILKQALLYTSVLLGHNKSLKIIKVNVEGVAKLLYNTASLAPL